MTNNKKSALCVHIAKTEDRVAYSRVYSWFLPERMSPKFSDVLMVENQGGVALVMFLAKRTVHEGDEHPQKNVLKNLRKVNQYYIEEFMDDLRELSEDLKSGWMDTEDTHGDSIAIGFYRNLSPEPVEGYDDPVERRPRRPRTIPCHEGE